MTPREEACAQAAALGHTMGPWRHIVGDDNPIVSCVCACGAWMIDLGDGRLGGQATRYGCQGACKRQAQAAEVFARALEQREQA